VRDLEKVLQDVLYYVPLNFELRPQLEDQLNALIERRKISPAELDPFLWNDARNLLDHYLGYEVGDRPWAKYALLSFSGKNKLLGEK
jgi:hypothetical protein